MKFLSLLLISMFSVLSFAQQDEIKSYLDNISQEIENDRELRIYIKRSFSTDDSLFRIYFKNDKCYAEYIQNVNLNKYPLGTKNQYRWTKFKCSEKDFMNFEIRNIQYLPKEEYFKYKKENKTVVLNNQTQEYNIKISRSSVVDGVGYAVKYKNGKNFNQFYYSNPKIYSEIYPEIDELKDFVEILKYIESEFKIKF